MPFAGLALVVLASLVPSIMVYAAVSEQPGAETGLSTYVVPGVHSYVKAGDGLLTTNSTAHPLTGELREWRRAIYRSDYCFLGTVLETRYDCVVEDRGGIESLAVVLYRIDEAYWGIESGTVIVDALSSRPRECVEYKFPTVTDLAAGRQYLVMGTVAGSRRHADDQGTIAVRDDGLFGPDEIEIGRLSEARPALNRVAERRSIRYQAEAADLVIYGTIRERHRIGSHVVVSATVDRLLKGAEPGQDLDVYLENAPEDAGIDDYFYAPRLEPDQCYLLFLVARPEGGYELVYGARSKLQLRGDDLYAKRDLLWGRHALADSIVSRVP